MKQWEQEFNAGFAVPEAIAEHPMLEDISWKNDVCPLFKLKGEDVYLLSDHPEVSEREIEDGKRFTIWAGELGVIEESDKTLLETDSTEEVLAFLKARKGDQ